MLALNSVLRRAILSGAANPLVTGIVSRHGLRFGAGRFVAGETLDAAVPVLRRLNEQGLLTNTTLLGEHVTEKGASAVVAAYETILERIASEQLRTNVALKLTHLGLGFGEETAYRNVERLVEKAASLGNFIRIDMEESRWVDATLRTYRRLRAEGHDNVGTVLQAYLLRTPGDLEAIRDLEPNLRIVKGAYLEPKTVAFAAKSDVDRSYSELVERMLGCCSFLGVATHDERLIEHTVRVVEQTGVPRERFQFQMLYGVRPQLQRSLAEQGYSVLVATPHGPDWYPYLIRRLAERPANLLFVVRNLLRE
jgi:proline dehydrogenase